MQNEYHNNNNTKAFPLKLHQLNNLPEERVVPRVNIFHEAHHDDRAMPRIG